MQHHLIARILYTIPQYPVTYGCPAAGIDHERSKSAGDAMAHITYPLAAWNLQASIKMMMNLLALTSIKKPWP